MASAEQYADWIVRNADKRGTPEFDTVAKAYQAAKQSMPEQAQAGADKTTSQRTWGKALAEGVGNIPSSGAHMLGGIYESLTSPVQTTNNLIDLIAGGMRNITPQAMLNLTDKTMNQEQKNTAQRVEKTANAVGQFYKQRYGSAEGLKQAVATDPVGVMADASSVLGLGGAALSKVPGMSGIAQKVVSAGRSVDPLNLAVKGAGKVASLVGKGVSEITGLQTGAGGQAVREAYKAGAAGGDVGQAFTGAMRGKTDMLDMLDEAKQNIAEMGRQRSAAYKSGMIDIKNDKSILSFDNIDKSLGSAVDSVTFKGKVKAPTAADALSKVQSEVEAWKNLDPAQYHTPEGLDTLKQRIGDIRESIPLQETNARRVVGQVYNSVKNEIAMQAPAYANTMKDYETASKSIKEIERTLSLGEKAAPDTAIRKLQSALRNNVNTNYGRRTELLRGLDTKGTIIPSIAGQALNEITPRGIQRMAAAPTAGIAYMVGGGLPAAGAALLSSPRLVGETAYGLGSIQRGMSSAIRPVGGLLDAAGVDPAYLANILYQAQQPKEAR